MDKEEILPILEQSEVLKDIPGPQLDWLIAKSKLRAFQPGEFLFQRGEPAVHMYIVLEGEFSLYSDQNGQRIEWGELEPGEITGVLPYSRMKQASGRGEATEPSLVLALHRDLFPEMICNHHELTEALVHQMTDRIRNFTTLQQQNEKLASLGKLSAGLAHELNNPSAAVVRSSEALKKHLKAVPERFKQVMMIKVTEQEVDVVNEVLFHRIQHFSNTHLSLMQRTALEDELADWMDDKGMSESLEWAEVFAEFGFTAEDFERVSEVVPDVSLEAVFGWMTSNLITEKMVMEISDASKRISDLVRAVKDYTHMDRAQGKQPVNLHEGLRSTAIMLGHKFRHNKVELVEQFGDIPLVPAFPGEVNQVFTNIMDNALDAMEERGGKLTVSTRRKGDFVEVDFKDNGPGIPPDVIKSVFDPFFTTKPMGKGTGMGLDLVMKIMKNRHYGDVKVTSEPGNTTFSLCFPLKA